jgi:hypothetical protein
VDPVFSLRGPVQKEDNKLVLRIPLEAGGSNFLECSRGISEIDGEYLKIVIPEWLAGTLRIEEGSMMSVDNANGKFNIHPLDPKPLQ